MDFKQTDYYKKCIERMERYAEYASEYARRGWIEERNKYKRLAEKEYHFIKWLELSE